MNNLNADLIVNAKGLACPMTIVRSKKAMNDIESGGHELLKDELEDDVFKFWIKKG